MNTYTAVLLLTLGVLIGVAFFVNAEPAASGQSDLHPQAGRKVVEPCAATAQGVPKATPPDTAKRASGSADWPLPPPAESAMTVEPARVFDILGSARLKGADGGYLLPDGMILFWGDGKEVTERAVSLLNPTDGHTQTIWQSDSVYLRGFILAPNRQTAWFVTEDVTQPDAFFVIDIPRRRVRPANLLYPPEALSLLEKAVEHNAYYQIESGLDGSLMVEWSNIRPIANWWGKTPEYWHMQSDREEEKVFSRAILSSPEERFRQGDKGKSLPVTFEVSLQRRIPKEHRPDPVVNGRHYAPISDGIAYSKLSALSMPAFGLRLQLFNRYLDPRTMSPCSAGNEVRNGELRVWSSSSSLTCARFQGAYVERAEDGRLLYVLNHGIGVPEGAAVSGRLFAMSGISEEPVIAKYVSLWDAPDGRLLARLALPRQAVGHTYPYTVLFSNDAKEVYCLTSYPKPMLYVWQLKPEWAALSSSALGAL